MIVGIQHEVQEPDGGDALHDHRRAGDDAGIMAAADGKVLIGSGQHVDGLLWPGDDEYARMGVKQSLTVDVRLAGPSGDEERRIVIDEATGSGQ